MNFGEMFERATGNKPFPYQTRLAEAVEWPDLLEAPTGAGKTAAIVLAWLWRRRYAPQTIRDQTPRRLVYCLPMRVLVEQTRDCVIGWLGKLGLDAEIGAYILMGGEQAVDWDLYPEREAILIGTQDMLLSRALNRGYGMSRYRWPMAYGLLNNDCQWVFDEVQLMGSGLATTAQLAAFRQKLGTAGSTRSLWASATLLPDWLATVDFAEYVPDLIVHGLSSAEWTQDSLKPRLTAAKSLRRAEFSSDKPSKFAEEVLRKHRPGTLTLVVLNTVKRARTLYAELEQAALGNDAHGRQKKRAMVVGELPELILLHSRFRPVEREEKMKRLRSAIPPWGRIVISTQVIEAGVDISARTLFTDLAPWPSLVQRFGRCNRYGEFITGEAQVFWIDLETTGKKHAAAPYAPEQLDVARVEIKKLNEVGPLALKTHVENLSSKRKTELYPYAVEHLLRRRDLTDLFDTTPDMSGNDVDVARYIREGEDLDVLLFWRDVNAEGPTSAESAPTRQELCAAPVGEFRNAFLKAPGHYAFLWDPVAEQWSRVYSAQDIYPGQVFLIPAKMGGYDVEAGWDTSATGRVEPVNLLAAQLTLEDATGRDPYVQGGWMTVSEHTDAVVNQARLILRQLGALLTVEEQSAMLIAARWHDWGKAHTVFQTALTEKHAPDHALLPGEAWAKAPNKDTRYARRAFRHELASALGMVAAGKPDLACYVVAAHHGKVRLSIRSLPNEQRPPDAGRRFARGVWEGDQLPATHLGGGETTPAVDIPLSLMEMGRSATGQSSWVERTLRLRDSLGPFRLAYLEMLLRAADMRASALNTLQEVPHA